MEHFHSQTGKLERLVGWEFIRTHSQSVGYPGELGTPLSQLQPVAAMGGNVKLLSTPCPGAGDAVQALLRARKVLSLHHTPSVCAGWENGSEPSRLYIL